MRRLTAGVLAFGLVALTTLDAYAGCWWCQKCRKYHCRPDSVSTTTTPSGSVIQTSGTVVGSGRVVNKPAVGVAMSSDAAEVLRLVNNYRAQNGRSPLILDQSMGAQAHAQKMSARRSMFHARGWVENVGYGAGSARQMVNMWIRSAGHRRNLLGPYSRMDVGRSGNAWAQRFR